MGLFGIKWNPIKDLGNMIDSASGATSNRNINDANAREGNKKYQNLLDSLSSDIMGEKLISEQTKSELITGLKASYGLRPGTDGPGSYDNYEKTLNDFKSVRDGLSMSEKSRVATEKFFQASQGYKQSESLVDAVARARNS